MPVQDIALAPENRVGRRSLSVQMRKSPGKGDSPVAAPPATLRILAIDDDKDTLDVIGFTLGEQYDVLSLSTPLDVYEMIDLFEPELIIMDVMMPKINGFQLLEILRKNPRTANLPILMLSAKAATTDIRHGYALGASLYLTKPFEPERLVKNVAAHFASVSADRPAKTLDIRGVQMQLTLKNAYKQGYARLTSRALVNRQPAEVEKSHEERLRLRESLDR